MEHLAAGVKSLEPSTTEKKPTDGQGGRSRMDGNAIDHALSQDKTVTVAKDIIEHNLSKEPAVPDEIEPQPPNLRDYHKGDRHPSPKSHKPHGDIQAKDAHWTKPHMGNQDQTHGAQGEHTISLASQSSSAKPSLNSKGPKKGLEVSREANDRITSQAQDTSLSQKAHVDLSSKKSTGKHNEPLSSPNKTEGIFQIFAEDELQKDPQNESNTAFESPAPRLKVTDIEHLLARKSAEELIDKSPPPQDTVAEEPRSERLPSITGDQPRKDSEMSTMIYDPRPVMPYNHMCAWRARYMDLKSQFDQLGLESGRQSPAKQPEGASTSCSHPNGDIDIEGLTVVMHLRGKDDLVINTDLRDGLQEHIRQR
ncbi:hypothetical protein F53441_553 [Fusarium austroafricanum]|uniref:Uncharacterized protein n=1 Tax=Fusarium austroafricanum TaxID=2364996 RepID=A0A8H4P4Z9_9HYPO|nr:hypothetical protein F53441_553 [Fusarium austroafricanum]